MKEQTMIAERYLIVSTLGSGGMADVYLAIDTILNREVAIKVLRGDSGKDPINLLRFQREASAVSKMHHPNVVEVYDVGKFGESNYIVMEYIRGKTLKQLIRQRGALDKSESVDIMKQLTSAVAHAHDNNVIHRDIKPQNVLIKDDGTVKITDFGIALAHDAVQLTQSDAVLGSAHYIAPETTRGEPSTVQIDIYALGIVFYELLSGSVPFTGDNPVQIAMKHMREDIPSIREFNPTIPQSIENIIVHATAKNRLQRYFSANEMLFDLQQCLEPAFSNVDKIELPTNEDAQDSTMIFDHKEQSETKETKATKQSKTVWYRVVAIVSVVLLLMGGTLVGVYYSGMFPSFAPIQYVEVPNIKGMSQDQATKVLEEKGLLVSQDITKSVTDDVASGIIFEQSPTTGTSLAKGSYVKLSISSGMYNVIKDYVGKNIDDVEQSLVEMKITVKTDDRYTSAYEPGYIIEQSLLNPGDKILPGEAKTIRFVVAASIMYTVPDFTGTKMETAEKTLSDYQIKYVKVQLDVANLTEEEKKNVQMGVVVKQSPAVGTLYIQQGDNVITLYYY